MPEVRVFREGTLRWVQASGTGAWNTASAPRSGLIGFVQAGFDFVQQKDFIQVMDRGVPKHHKLVSVQGGKASFNVLFGVTADYPDIITSSGVSTPQIHLEFRQQMDEVAAASGLYFQLLNAVELGRKFTEDPQGNKYQINFEYLSSVGPTGSGYLG